MICEHLSPSRIDLYQQCPLRYHCKYEKGMCEIASDAILTGYLVHNALELYYSPHFNLTPDEAFEKAIGENSCIDLSEYKQAIDMVHESTSVLDKNEMCVIDTEIPFTHLFDSGLTICGRIDCLDLLDNHTMRIIDFKTGHYVASYKEMEDSHQANMYPLWIYEDKQFEDIETVIFALYYVREGIFKEIQVSYDTVKLYKQYLDNVFRRILSDDSPTSKLNSFCWNCPNRYNCDEYRDFVSCTFSYIDDMDINNLTFQEMAHVVNKMKSGIKNIKKVSGVIADWLVTMLKDMESECVTTDSGVTVSVNSRRKVKYDYGMVKALAEDRGVLDQVVTVSNTNVKKAFKGDAEALELIEKSATVEDGKPFISIKENEE